MGSVELNYDITLDDVEYDIDVNKNEVEGELALLHAAIRGDFKTIEKLIKSGICVDAKEYNKLLFYASKNYVTPLQLATMHGHDKCVQLLIDYGADVNAKDLFGFTALHLAACNGAHSILKLLLRARADCSAPLKFSYCVPLKISVGTGCCKIPHLGGTTPLHLAAATNNVNCVKELIRYGADFNAVDEHGRTSLYVAAQLGYSECVLIHLKEAVGRDILSLPSFKTSDTPLHFAVKYHMIDCVKELLYLGSDVNHRNFDGLSPLHTALLPSNSSMDDVMAVLKLLILEGYKTDINQPDWEGFTPLHYVCFNGHRNMWLRRPEMAKFLIAHGANVNIKDYHKCSLLEQELKFPEENFDILKYLVKSLLYLPPLKSLNIISPTETEITNQLQTTNARNPPEHQNNPDWIHIPFLHPGRIEPLHYFPGSDSVVEMSGMLRLLPEGFPRPSGNLLDPLNSEEVQFHRSFILDALMDAYGAFNDTNVSENQNIMERDSKIASAILKKQLWYEELASSPRTLQHHCRFVIRRILGPMKLKYIKKLPIPPLLQSYLLFKLKE